METKNYENGKIKVVWIDSDPENIYSKMFEDEKSALDFASFKENYLLFSLNKQKNMEEFSWRLLPYGKYKAYRVLIGGIANKSMDLTSLIKNII